MLLSELTTMGVGGPAREVLEPATREELVSTALDVWASGDEWLVLGGGSNVVVGDDGIDGSVIRVLDRGIDILGQDAASVRLRVQAGEPWDDLVAHTVAQGWAGIEALSGIPGSTGAAPIQNIGAYGQEVGDALLSIEFLDYLDGDVVTLSREELGLAYRTSTLKQGRQGIVLSIDLALTKDPDGPIAFPQLAQSLGVALGARVALAEVRAAVLALRAAKGMVLDAADPDSASCGSFFTNPIVSENFARGLPGDAPRWLQDDDASVKLSAAWLIEHSGVGRGFALPGSRAAISSKHTLAITNRGGATAEQVAELARYIRSRVLAEFGVLLHPEPVTVGVEV